jgi:hypothetical protein
MLKKVVAEWRGAGADRLRLACGQSELAGAIFERADFYGD